MTIGYVLSQIWAGKTIFRAYHNAHIRGHVVVGRTIDLGARDASSSYHRLMRFDGEVTYTDLIPRGPGVIAMDLEQPFPQADASYDNALLFNVLELIWNHRGCLAETRRILKPGGRLIGVVPFFTREHDDPADYFRYTRRGMRRLLEEAGYRNVAVEPIAPGPFKSAFYVRESYLRPAPVRAFAAAMALLLDAGVKRLSGAYGDYYAGLHFEADA